MHLYNVFCGITVPLSNSEHDVVQKVNKVQYFNSKSFSQNEDYIASELCFKGILKFMIKDSTLYYYVNRQELDREPLL